MSIKGSSWLSTVQRSVVPLFWGNRETGGVSFAV
ncbi:hypothetical protein MY4038_008377 [Beauveria bassiana]